MSHLFNCSASSVLLVSMITSSESDDYYSCVDEMTTDQYLPEETLFNEADLEELNIPLEAEADDPPSAVLIYFVTTSLITLPNPPLCSLPPLSFIFPSTVEQAVQSSKHDFRQLSGGVMTVVWDHRLPGTFPTPADLPWKTLRVMTWREETFGI